MAMSIDNGKDYFVKEFYKRTLKVLTSYEGEYDVAMMINSMVGLLVVPKERYFKFKRVDDTYIDADLLAKLQATFSQKPDICLHEILRCLRNSVAHGNMEIKAEEPNIIGEPMKIGSILFADRDGTSAEIPIELLRSFLISFATNVCNN